MKIIIFALLISTAIFSKESIAQDCRGYEAKVEYYTDLRRNGGTARQMTYWQSERNRYKNLYQGCKRGGGNTGSIDKVRRSPPKNSYASYRDHVHSNTNDKTLKKLIKTCNYWISTHNNHPSFDNRNYRDIACKAVSTREMDLRNPAPAETPIVRSVKECMKPNNLIDEEVKDCAQGKISPYWLVESDSEVCDFWINEYKKDNSEFNGSRLAMACQSGQN